MAQRDFFAFCKTLRLVELKAIGQLSCVRHFAEGEMVYSATQPGDEFLSSIGGRLSCFRQIIGRAPPRRCFPGDLFGESGPLMEQARDQTARACATLSVQCFHRRDFPALIERSLFLCFHCRKTGESPLSSPRAGARPEQRLELSGGLANFDIVTIYQTIIQSMQTGLLTIANEDGETISTFYFDKGTPRWGRFQHLKGEEAFWQLFLHEHHSGSFFFPIRPQVGSDWGKDSALTRQPDEILINAIQMRDQFDDLRKQIRDSGARIRRLKLNLDWNDGEFSDLRPVARRNLAARAQSHTNAERAFNPGARIAPGRFIGSLICWFAMDFSRLESNQAEPALVGGGT